jgi:hypothetical protein
MRHPPIRHQQPIHSSLAANIAYIACDKQIGDASSPDPWRQHNVSLRTWARTNNHCIRQTKASTAMGKVMRLWQAGVNNRTPTSGKRVTHRDHDEEQAADSAAKVVFRFLLALNGISGRSCNSAAAEILIG